MNSSTFLKNYLNIIVYSIFCLSPLAILFLIDNSNIDKYTFLWPTFAISLLLLITSSCVKFVKYNRLCVLILFVLVLISSILTLSIKISQTNGPIYKVFIILLTLESICAFLMLLNILLLIKITNDTNYYDPIL